MAIKEVIRMGHPLLLQVATPVQQFDSPELHALIADLEDTMLDMNGAGIAAQGSRYLTGRRDWRRTPTPSSMATMSAPILVRCLEGACSST